MLNLIYHPRDNIDAFCMLPYLYAKKTQINAIRIFIPETFADI
jgi:hypothetical protein